MSVRFNIADASGLGYGAKVTSRGQLVVSPLDYSTAYNATADVINTAYNLIEPRTGQRFVITAILLYANKNVGAGDATVVLYEATSSSTTTASKTIFTAELPKSATRDLTNLNLIVSEGVWVNIKTDDDDIFATIFGYYIDA